MHYPLHEIDRPQRQELPHQTDDYKEEPLRALCIVVLKRRKNGVLCLRGAKSRLYGPN